MTVIDHFHDLFNKNKYCKYAQILFFEILPFHNNFSPFLTTTSTTQFSTQFNNPVPPMSSIIDLTIKPVQL